jgi:uncharacterized membrane protein YdbT with pleckstrin-like domain
MVGRLEPDMKLTSKDFESAVIPRLDVKESAVVLAPTSEARERLAGLANNSDRLQIMVSIGSTVVGLTSAELIGFGVPVIVPTPQEARAVIERMSIEVVVDEAGAPVESP